jgi:hypothetical protein
MKIFQSQKRKELIHQFQLLERPAYRNSSCLGCKHARLQITDKNPRCLDEYPSPAIVAEYHQQLSVIAVCTATGLFNTLEQINHCELMECLEPCGL